MAVKKQFPKSIYSILLITVLLFGTCLGNIQTVLGAVYALSASFDAPDKENAAIRPAGGTLPVQHFLTDRNAGSRKTAIDGKRSSQKTILRLGRIISCLLFSGRQADAKQYIFSYFTANRSIPARLAHIVIIGYIHLKDGQKSCISFLP